ncbi:M16 family metallopeptidase [Chitinibacter tainanensis]|uniref:M16 family metallopeptidase n=1 Tax=Chitinibacter tainanensis TaxID=230667 RepID=UPI0023547200|nr:insulinase family protein [Chitinibacter tainanensis]
MWRAKRYLGVMLLMVWGVVTPAAWAGNQALAVSPSVVHGELPNGVRYFIKRNLQPAGQVQAHLLVNVGSVHEQDQELGFAHLLEHLAFRGTQHFTHEQIKALLEREGVVADSNAHTYPEYTRYELSLKPAQMPAGLQLLADWASQGIAFEDAHFQAEQKIVLAEEITRRASAKYWQSVYDSLIPDSVYARRLPIGDKAVIRAASLQKVRQFYQREYQAQRMVVMVAGDIDPQQIEQQIKTLFAPLVRGEAAAEFKATLPLQPLQQFVDRDLGIAQSTLQWSWRLGQLGQGYDLQTAYSDEVIAGILEKRLLQRSLQTESALQRLEMDQKPGGVIPNREIELSFELEVKDNRLKDGLREMYQEFVRAKQHGFTAEEIAATAAQLKRESARVFSNESWVNRMLNHVRYGYPLITPEERQQLREQLAAKVTPEGLQQRWKDLLDAKGQMVFVLQPSNLVSFTSFSLSSLQSMMAEVRAQQLPALNGKGSASAAAGLVPQTISRQSVDAATGGVTFYLPNGIEILVIPAKTPSNKIALSGFSPLGIVHLQDKKLYRAALVLPYVHSKVGFGGLSSAEYQQFLREYSLTMGADFNPDSTQIAATSVPDGLEGLLLGLRYFLQGPKFDAAVLDESQKMAYQSYYSGTNSLYASLSESRYGENWPYKEDWYSTDFEANLAQLQAVQQKLLGNPAQFKFVLAGVEPKQAQPLLEKYLANLPVTAANTEPAKAGQKWLGLNSPSQVKQRIRGSTAWRVLQVDVPLAASQDNLMLGLALSEVIHDALNQALREVAGDVYGVQYSTALSPAQGMLMTFEFKHDDGRCSEVVASVEQVLKKLFKEPPTAATAELTNTKMNQMLERIARDPVWRAYWVSRSWMWNGTGGSVAMQEVNYTPAQLHQYLQDWLKPSRWTSGTFNCRNEVKFDKLLAEQ